MLPQIPLADYHYELPDERIARYPEEPRDTSKLLVYRNGAITHDSFFHLTDFLSADNFLVFNDTKVIPARLFFQKPTGSVIELFLLHPEAPTRIVNDAMVQAERCTWSCMIGNKKRWKKEEILNLQFTVENEIFILEAKWEAYDKNWVTFSWKSSDCKPLIFVEVIKALGEIPLPPYLNRKAKKEDLKTYQTVYSQVEGAVAAPTAGLHFTDNIFEQLAKKEIKHDFVTLHVGAGTFQPVKVANAVEHTMHAEQVVFRKKFIEKLILKIRNIIVVGTTSMRSLESLYWFGVQLCTGHLNRVQSVFFIEKLAPYENYQTLPSPKEALEAIIDYMNTHHLSELVGETEIMIFPGYDFKLCKGLITNYHQPGSTLMLLVAAFVGTDWRKIYTEAMDNGYRFLSYGDSSLLFNE